MEQELRYEVVEFLLLISPNMVLEAVTLLNHVDAFATTSH
jgi:hypothetical protein